MRQTGELVQGEETLGGKDLIQIRGVVAAVADQGQVLAGQGLINVGGDQQLLPVSLAPAAVVRQIKDQVGAVPTLPVEVRQDGTVRLVLGGKTVDFHIAHPTLRQQEGDHAASSGGRRLQGRLLFLT